MSVTKTTKAFAIGSVLFALAVSGTAVIPAPVIPPCASDDGSGPVPCHWDAQKLGNHLGESFTTGG